MRVKNIVLVGTSHISPQSLKAVRDVIKKRKPDIVALELDRARLHGLLAGPEVRQRSRLSLKDIRKIGFKGWVFGVLGAWLERKLGKRVGVLPGEEMLTAFYAAREQGSRIALIDQPLEITLRKFGQALTWREKARLLGDVFAGFMGKGMTFDLEKVPSQKLIAKLLKQVKKRYPNLHRVLVEERNAYMAENLVAISKTHPDQGIIAVIGAGHVTALAHLLKKTLAQKL